MATTNFDSGSLAPSYNVVQRALEERARLAQSDSGKYGYARAVTKPVSDEIVRQKENSEKEELLKFKFALDDELGKRDFMRGRRVVTDADLEKLAEGLLGDKTQAELFASMKGLPMNEKEASEAIANALKRKGTIDLSKRQTSPEGKAAVLIDPEQAAKAATGGAKGKGQFVGTSNDGKTAIVFDPESQTFDTVPLPNSDGFVPRGAAGSVPAREEKKRKEFVARAKDAGYVGKRDAFTGALNALENTSVANDINLIYSVAKSRDNTGRLSDQDIEQAGRAGNLPGDLQKWFNFTTTQKELLPDQVRETLVQSVVQSYQQGEKNLRSLEETYSDLAAQESLNPGNVAINLRPKDNENAKIVEYLMANNKKVTAKNIQIIKKSGIHKRGNQVAPK